ncbi:MAG: monovalent cation/H(+) antiporter subunit G [Verrucomicrobiae bacterium]|nr:monovalent cation/H(+) antiporter subunit G [Verrucomicrobiae bacterium]
MKDLLLSLLVLSGTTLIVIAAIGVIRLPDVLCRSHAVAKAVTLGILLLLGAVWVELGTEAAGLKVALAMVFQFATIPVGSHLVARLAREKNLPRWRGGPDNTSPGGPAG